MISVVIPLYNKETNIAKTLRTVLNQTFQQFEIIVVNDGSTDNSATEASKVLDDRIRIVNQENAGVSAARNRGIAEAKYDLIAFLDADDEWKADYLETQYTLYKKYPECSVFACNYELHNADGRIIQTIIKKLLFDTEDGILTNYFEVASCSHPPICSISIMVKRQAIQDIGGFPLGIKSGEDLLTWARLACNSKIAYSRKPLAVFNVEGYSVKEKPKRLPAENDIVASELKLLRNRYRVPGLGKYISTWYKMRSSIYMRLGQRRNSLREAFNALKYNPLNYKIYAYIFINLLPSRFQPF